MLRFYKNQQILRTFSRDLATDAKADQDMVKLFIFDRERVSHGPISLKIVVLVVATL